MKGQAKNSQAQRSPIDNAGRKGNAPDDQRKPEAKASASTAHKDNDRKAANERAQDDKRPGMKGKRN